MASYVVFRCCLIMITNLFAAFDFAYAQPTRAFFVFGDSLADNGNNHFLFTTLRADFPPYGIDFPTHKPTGRFSNGLNIPDIISEQLGLEMTLPYLSPLLTDEKLLVGANFASAGVGILNDTGIQFLHIMHIDKQLELFEHYQQRLSAHIGAEEAKKLVNKALALIILGGNDFVNNYYWVPFSARFYQFSLPDYVTYLISEFKIFLKKFYDLGGRKVLVMGMGPMGCCIPVELALWSRNGDCNVELVRAASLYDRQFVEMIKELNTEIGDDVFIAVIAHKIFMDFVNNPHAFGFVTSKKACCGQGLYNGIGPCLPLSNLCPNRDLYAFWDSIHPSEKACRIIVQQILNGSTEYMYPMNLSTVLAMDPMRERRQWQKVNVQSIKAIRGISKKSLEGFPFRLDYVY